MGVLKICKSFKKILWKFKKN